MAKGNRDRLNVYLVPELNEYLHNQAEAYGMTVSAYLTMVIQQYRQQSSLIENIPRMLTAMKEKEKPL